MVVLAEGGRGKGNLILGFSGKRPDTTSPLESVIAYGAVETAEGTTFVTVRRYTAGQIDVEFDSTKGEEIPAVLEERRWTYSTWRPGDASPETGGTVREVAITPDHTLAVSCDDRRLWVYERQTSMNILIPITSYYGELMARRRIRDPKIALRPGRFFDELGQYGDEDLGSAFLSYNNIHPKVVLNLPKDREKQSGAREILMRVFSRKQLHE